MSSQTTSPADETAPSLSATGGAVVNWALDAPRGGRAVMNRILKDGATVPLFFAQTLIASLRDVGYNHTTSALCEHVDNAVEAGATEIRVFFRQIGKKGQYRVDTAVYDNGPGMSPSVLKVATSFGGSMNYNNRNGIGRFGMGMKTAALSMSPVMELFSWQEPGAYYNMTLDVEAVGKERVNLVELPDPTLLSELPDEISELLTQPVNWPDASEQQLFSNDSRLFDRLGKSGTIVYMPNCDRLSSVKARTLAEHAVREMSRVYRRAIDRGLKLFVNNRVVEPFDPMYYMAKSRHVRFLDGIASQSRLIIGKPIALRIAEDADASADITVRIYKLPIEEWAALPRKTLNNDLQVFSGLTVSILRNDREVFAGELPALTTHHSVTNWYRVQIDFPGVLDEAFGVAANKQGVRMKDYVLKAIKEAMGDNITALNDEIKHFQGQQASARRGTNPSTSESRANDADAYQPKPLRDNLTDAEKEQLEANLRGLAVALKRDGETEDEALTRIKNSKYLIQFKHDQYWPFYHVEHKFDRVILTINTAHGFFTQLYEPIQKLIQISVEGDQQGPSLASPDQGPLVALELLLLSLARTQSVMEQSSEESRKVLEMFRREWSDSYRVQLGA